MASNLMLDCAPCATIDEVVARLDQMIEQFTRERSRLGYFAVLYRNVTARVRDEIAAGSFEDGPRMERLDVVFANRYFEAYDQAMRRGQPSESWSVAFGAAGRRPPVILQHLLLGMSAHINLDLAIAAAQAAPGEQLPTLKHDFLRITDILIEMVDQVQERINQVSPWMHLFDRLGGRLDERLFSLVMQEAREHAWETAEQLAALPPAEFEAFVRQRDQAVAGLGRTIRSPGLLVGLGLRVIRLRETSPVPRVIQTLKL